MYLKEDNLICIVASKGGNPKNPGWYHNLKNNPEAKIQIGRERFNVVAREIFDLERIDIDFAVFEHVCFELVAGQCW